MSTVTRVKKIIYEYIHIIKYSFKSFHFELYVHPSKPKKVLIILDVDSFKIFGQYSSLSNKRAGWNKMCRLENLVKI